MINDDRRLWKLLLFSLPTFGIYNIYFWFQFTKDLNEINTEEKPIRNYFLVLFLSVITLGIYRWVWFFYLADRIQETGLQMNLNIKPGPGTTLFIRLFGSFILIGPIVSDFIVIHNMNTLAAAHNSSIARKTKVVKD